MLVPGYRISAVPGRRMERRAIPVGDMAWRVAAESQQRIEANWFAINPPEATAAFRRDESDIAASCGLRPLQLRWPRCMHTVRQGSIAPTAVGHCLANMSLLAEGWRPYPLLAMLARHRDGLAIQCLPVL